MNYKVGDIVRIIANTTDHGYQIGDLVEITEEHPLDYDSVNSLTGDIWFINEDEIQLFKRKEVNETNTDNTTSGL